MDATFGVYGLRLGSNRNIPGLVPRAFEPRVDVRIHFGSLPGAALNFAPREPDGRTAPAAGASGQPEAVSWRLDDGHGKAFRLRYDDGTEFIVDDSGSRIWAVWPASLTLEDTAVYLLGPVLAFVLRLRGSVCLHASAFSVNGRAVALVGPSGAGKSTTAAALAVRGFSVLCDDLLAIAHDNGNIVVHPGYPRLRLWPDASNLLSGVPGELPRLTPNWDKRYLQLEDDADSPDRQPLALAAVYLLDERRNDTETPVVESLDARARLLSLLANLRGDFHLDKDSYRREFEMLGHVAKRVPVRRVVGCPGPASVPRLCDAILEDVSSIFQQPSTELDLACTI